MFGQGSGWTSGASPVTGEKWVMKQCISESGSGQSYYFKVWRTSEIYRWTLTNCFGDYMTSLTNYGAATVTVKIKNNPPEWSFFYKDFRMRPELTLWEKSISNLKIGSFLKFENIGSTFYLDLKGFSNALESL